MTQPNYLSHINSLSMDPCAVACKPQSQQQQQLLRVATTRTCATNTYKFRTYATNTYFSITCRQLISSSKLELGWIGDCITSRASQRFSLLAASRMGGEHLKQVFPSRTSCRRCYYKQNGCSKLNYNTREKQQSFAPKYLISFSHALFYVILILSVLFYLIFNHHLLSLLIVLLLIRTLLQEHQLICDSAQDAKVQLALDSTILYQYKEQQQQQIPLSNLFLTHLTLQHQRPGHTNHRQLASNNDIAGGAAHCINFMN